MKKASASRRCRPATRSPAPRIPTPTKVCNAVAIQRGTERPNDVVIITGHIDSRVTDPMDFTADAPGANDDGRAPRRCSRRRGSCRSTSSPARSSMRRCRARSRGCSAARSWPITPRRRAGTSSPTSTTTSSATAAAPTGSATTRHVRVFSEGPRWQGHEDLAAGIRSLGGENDAPVAQPLALPRQARRPAARSASTSCRSGATTASAAAATIPSSSTPAIPAVRFSVAVENYNHQHQDLRTENGVEYGDTIDKMDFPYLAKVTKLNVAALAWLASAPPPPEPTVEGAVSTDTTVSWPTAVPGAGVTSFAGVEPIGVANWVGQPKQVPADRVLGFRRLVGQRRPVACPAVARPARRRNEIMKDPRRRLGVRRRRRSQGRLRKPGARRAVQGEGAFKPFKRRSRTHACQEVIRPWHLTGWRLVKAPERCMDRPPRIKREGQHGRGHPAPQPTSGLPTRQQILDFIASSDQPAGKREIARAFGLPARTRSCSRRCSRTWPTKGLIDARPAAPSTRRAACPRSPCCASSSRRWRQRLGGARAMARRDAAAAAAGDRAQGRRSALGLATASSRAPRSAGRAMSPTR